MTLATMYTPRGLTCLLGVFEPNTMSFFKEQAQSFMVHEGVKNLLWSHEGDQSGSWVYEVEDYKGRRVTYILNIYNIVYNTPYLWNCMVLAR